jgi:DNA-binding XRE family transcriptional regulator
MKHPLEEAYDSCMMAYEQSRTVRSIGRRTFAQQLRETRRKLNMTVRELGERIGVTGSLINQIEVNSKSILKKEQVEKIIELCVSSLKSRKGNTSSASAPTPRKHQQQCTNEECHSQPVTDQNMTAWSWPPSDFNN